MPLVGIDCRFGSTYGGLGTYTRSLVAALLWRDDPWEYVLFVDDEESPWVRGLASPRADIVQAAFPHYSFAEQAEFPNLIQDHEPDVMFFPHFNVPLSCPVPFLCTVHDLILHRFPNEAGYWKRLAYRFVMRQALSRASAILAVSDFTKSDLRSVYGTVFDAKTSVVYPGVSPVFAPAPRAEQERVRKQFGLSRPFLLYVGNCKEHKNVPVLLEAFTRASLGDVDLVLLTGGKETAHLHRSAHVRFLTGVSEEDLPALLSASLACVTATLLEGFCLPLLEAMACGVPVVATDVGPIPEVTGGFALLSRPSVAAMSDALNTVVRDPACRSHKRTSDAAAWASAFSWIRTADQTAEVISALL